MNLYLIKQSTHLEYDTYDAAVVAASSESDAKLIHPAGREVQWGEYQCDWVSDPNDVEVTYIGVAAASIERGVVLASFNAG